MVASKTGFEGVGVLLLQVEKICDGVVDTFCLFVHAIEIFQVHVYHSLLVLEALLDVVLGTVLAMENFPDSLLEID